jgi:threonine dehydrogenase-like Zn-dependent dehydrogenase
MVAKKMWAQTLTGPCTFELGDVAAPTRDSLRVGDVLLRLLAGGICGSVSPVTIPAEYGGLPKSPLGAPLREVVGEVVATRDPSLAARDRVVGWASSINGVCEYVIAEVDGLATFDPDLAPAAAVMLLPLACVLWVMQRASPAAGKRVAVIWQGPIGVLFSHVLGSLGAGCVRASIESIDPKSRPHSASIGM